MNIKQQWGVVLLLLVFSIPYTTYSATLGDFVVSSDTTLPAGEYVYDSLVVQSGATLLLEGDPTTSSVFKGVKIQATNITIEAGAFITADKQGYPSQQGPGSSLNYRHGGSYGGVGSGNVGTSTYGSSIYPTHLGSGGGYSSGGGAVDLAVLGTLHIDGTLSANGDGTGSGGSINITTDTLSGSGSISAQGGSYRTTAVAINAGGGGRVFAGYTTITFDGLITVRGGKKYSSSLYAQSGTAALYDKVNDELQTLERWQFDGIYGPFAYASIETDIGEFIIENGADVSVGDFGIRGESAVSVDLESNISAANIILSNDGILAYGGRSPLVVYENLRLEDTSTLQGAIKVRLQVDAKNIIIDSDAQIHVDGMGYQRREGPGSPEEGTRAGGSYGGRGLGVSAKLPYGSAENPVDFGSAGDFHELGGGALLLNVSDRLQHDGVISAQGKRAASGGSVWVDANVLTGVGVIKADGGKFGANAHYIGAGAGGRVAVYTSDASVWAGTSTAKGGIRQACGGCPTVYAENGSVVFEEETIIPIDPLLLQYAPILYMHEDEDYFPMNVESFVEDSALWSQDGIGDTLLQSEENLTFEEFESVVQNDDTSNYYLAYSDPANGGTINLAEAKAKYNRATSSGEATTTVYVYKMLDGYTDEQGNDHEFIVLQYWYFYAMNNWLEQGGRNNHEGDWESVFIFLDAETEEAMHVAYSAHHNDGDSSDDILQVESVRREWEDNEVLKNGDMVKSFVSLGSHAMYPSVGTVNVLGKNDISSVDGQKLEINNSSEVHSVSTTGPVWMNYGGKWGTDKVDILDSQSGPLGPNYTNVSGHLRFHEPVKWAGIDQSSEFIISEPTTAITSTVAQVTMQFTDALQEGTVVTIDPHKEYISFGTTITDTTFLPRYYDFDTSMLNGTFEVEVTLAYTDEELLALELDEDDLSIFYYNAVTDSWEEVDATVDSVENTISFTTDHFSRYAIGVPEEVEYSVEELFDLFRHEVGETDLRSYQKRFLKRYSKFVERFIARDTDKAIRVAKRLLARLERKLEKFEKWSVLSQEERDAFSELLGKIQEKI